MKIETIEQLTTLLKENALVPETFNVEVVENAVKNVGDNDTAIGVYSRLAAQAIFENKESIEFLEERDRNTVEEWLKTGEIENGKALDLITRATSNQTKHGWRDESKDDEHSDAFKEYGSIFEQGKVTTVKDGENPMKAYSSIFEQGQQPNS
ncbi:hypothetical protein CGH76_23125 [Vibrio parahaemolyticus]|uniref:hypothetical protein n=1 Tax=Vibrio parahaemolyticus TaxID=670 RepID=UPI00111DB4E2|nr:hypothetical protein [Vibrio parahaemolyticus]TOM45743.1 hypothetical protein CGH76_23125 [Vibrio parahaemolyticus]